jgi:hypothetical protein
VMWREAPNQTDLGRRRGNAVSVSRFPQVARWA